MDTASFLRKVLPSEGNYIIAEPSQYTDNNGKQRQGWKYHKHTSISQATAAVEQLDDAGHTVYFAVNAYGDWYDDPQTGRRRLRTQKNVVACRSLYDDVDTGEGKAYATKPEAIAAIKAMVSETQLLPLVVDSGGGYHLYWTLDTDVTPEEWLRLAALKRAVFEHIGLKVDHAVDMDTARVLRPAGSHNRKKAEPRPVKVVRDAGPYTVEKIEGALRAYLDKHNLTVLPPAPKGAEDFGNLGDLGGGVEYPPSSAHEIIKHCPTMKHIVEVGGNVIEPLWRSMIGVVKHTVEGEALAHEWSAGHPQYDYDETQSKLDNWVTGPALCETFAKESPHCTECKHNGKARSPITLGYTGDTKAPEIRVEPTEEGVEAPAPVLPKHWPNGFHWDGIKLSKGVRNEEGGVEYVPFASTLFYPETRVRTEDGTWGLVIRANPGSRNDRTFVIPTKSVAETQSLAAVLASYEVFTMGKNGRSLVQEYLQGFVGTYQRHGIETITYPHFGWYDGFESFILGSKKLTKTDEVDVLTGKTVGSEMNELHQCKGDVNSWVDLVDLVYNRKGAEPYQFVICAALAAPLVEFTASNVWHGMPIALTGGPGEGKTSAMSVACSMYGPPDRFLVNGNDNGMTINAAIGRFAAMHNLPVILDEMSGRDQKEISGLLYALSNGRSKIRLTSDGSPHPLNEGRWNMLSFISGNEEFAEKLVGLTHHIATATELRVFDIKVQDGFSSRVFGGINVKNIVEEGLLRSQYGHAGRKWLRFLLKNRDKVATVLDKEMARWTPGSQAENQERFYHNTLIHIMVAGRLAQKLGLVRFNMDRLEQWGKEQIARMRSGRDAVSATPDDYLAQFLSDIYGRTIITKRFSDKRYGTSETVPESLVQDAKFKPAARQAIEDKKFFIAVPAFNEWCRERSLSPSWLRDELIDAGCIIKRNGETVRRESLGKGTNLALAHTRVYELDYGKVIGAVADIDASGKVIHLPSKPAPSDDLDLDTGSQ